MKVQYRIRGVNATAELRRWLGQSLERLRKLIPVSNAAVVLERQRESAPAFRAFVHLAVPGPDIHAEARENTLQAVWLKVTDVLRKRVGERENRRKARVKNKHVTAGSGNRWGLRAAGAH